MPTTFTWFPDTNPSNTSEPRVLVAKFGDGYEQRAPDGINNLQEAWALRFTKDYVVGMEIVNFIKARAGAEAFYWADPNGVTKLFVCRKWSYGRMTGEGVMEVSCTFEETAG